MTKMNRYDLRDIDKLEENYTLRIPEITKHKIDKLPKNIRDTLNYEILITIAHVLHEADFDPRLYLSSD